MLTDESFDETPELRSTSKFVKEKTNVKIRRSYDEQKAATHRIFYEKPKVYYELGGLGANIGTQEWAKKKEMQDKRAKYAHTIQKVNTKIIKPMHVLEPIKPYTLKDKALDFAKSVPRPQKKKIEEPVQEKDEKKYTTSYINHLDLRHEELKKSVDEIRKKFQGY